MNMMHSVVPSQQQSLDNGVGKTPARSGTRRALGDISNRKTSVVAPFNSNNNQDHNVSKTPLLKKLVAATTTTSTTTKLPLPNHHPQPQPSLRNATATTSKRSNSNAVTFILPDETTKSRAPAVLSQQLHLSTTDTIGRHIGNHNSLSLWNLDDESEIELPAGRLYHQQLQLYDDDDDNESQLSLEGATTFREDFVNQFMEEHNRDTQDKENYMQHCIQTLEKSCNISDDDAFLDDDHHSRVLDESIDHEKNNSIADEELHSTYIDFPPLSVLY